MGCPVLRLLPEIADVANQWEGPKGEVKLLTVARNICQACREKTPHEECPLGERFGSSVRRRLPEIFKMVARILKKGGD